MNTAVAHNEENIYLQIDRCMVRINECQSEIRKIESELATVNSELESISDERQKYEVLTAVCESLEKLAEIGGNDLFWSGLASDTDVDNHLNRLRDQASFFERRIKR